MIDTPIHFLLAEMPRSFVQESEGFVPLHHTWGFLMCPLRRLGPQACHGAAALFLATPCLVLLLTAVPWYVLHQSNAPTLTFEADDDDGDRFGSDGKQGVVSLLHTTRPVSVTLVLLIGLTRWYQKQVL